MEVSKVLNNKKMHTVDWMYIACFINLTEIHCLSACEEGALMVSVSEDTSYELNDLKELVALYSSGGWEGTEEEFILQVRSSIHWLMSRMQGHFEI